MNWKIETTKQGAEIYVTCEAHSIFIGEGYTKQEQSRSLYLANIIVKALNKHDK
jgi:hypothetical protein